MDSLSAAVINAASSIQQTSAQQQIGIAVLKTAMNVQAAGAVALIQALPQPGLASSGNLGTLVNAFA